MKKEVLTRPFPPELIRQRQGQGGKMLSYVETHAVIARLNEGCDAWNFTIGEHQILPDDVVVIGRPTSDGRTKIAFSGSAITRDPVDSLRHRAAPFPHVGEMWPGGFDQDAGIGASPIPQCGHHLLGHGLRVVEQSGTVEPLLAQ